jgi:hypothetical protein
VFHDHAGPSQTGGKLERTGSKHQWQADLGASVAAHCSVFHDHAGPSQTGGKLERTRQPQADLAAGVGAQCTSFHDHVDPVNRPRGKLESPDGHRRARTENRTIAGEASDLPIELAIRWFDRATTSIRS